MNKHPILRGLFCFLLCLSMVLQPLAMIPVHATEPTELITNGTFADTNNDGKADGWTYWFGSDKECPSSVGEDGLTITADSTSGAQRLTVHQTTTLVAGKTYRLTLRYQVTSTAKGSLEIRHNGTGASQRLAYHTSKTDGWQTVDHEFVAAGNMKLEIVVSQGATLTCSVDDVSLVEVVEEPEVPAEPTYVDTLLKNGTFLDADGNNLADSWTHWNGTNTAAPVTFGENGSLTIAADSSVATQRLTVHQTVTGLDANKTYRFSGEYQVTSTAKGSLEIGYIPNASGSRTNAVKVTNSTDGVQRFEVTINGMTSVKLEAAVSSGATLTCTINNFKLEEVPSYTVTFDANGGTGTMNPMVGAGSIVLPEGTFTAPEGCTFAGWLVNGEVKAAGDTITFGSDITVKAQWDDGNLLKNPTYLNTDISSITSWNYYPAYAANAGANYNASVADGVFTGTVLGGSNLILHQTVPMNADTLNKTYRFTADIKTENISGYAMFKIYLQNASGKQLSSFNSTQIKGTSDWTTLTMEFEVPASVGGDPVASIKLEQYILKGTGTASFRNPKMVITGEFTPDPEGDPMDSLVKNGGYETTLAGFPASWNLWTSTGGLNAESDRTVFKDGYSSLHLSNVTPGSDSRGSVHQTFNINTDDLKELWGQSVKIGQWVKTKDFVGDALMIRVHYATVSGAYIAKSIPVQSTQDWTYYEYIIDLPDTNFATIKVENLYEYGQGDVWIDNTVVTKYIKAKSLTLNADKVVLPVNGTKGLTVTFTPANTTIKEVTWTSSNASVATVEGGKITAVAPGMATITVTHVDGMSKQIAVLVADSEMDFSKNIAISTTQNTSTSGTLPEGYTYQVAAAPQFGTFLVENGVYTYYPAKDFKGSDSVTLLVTSSLRTATQCLVVVPLTVTEVNSAPEFDRMTIITNVGQPVAGSFAATDPENDELTFTVVTQPENGTVAVDGSSYTFTPNAGFQGYDAVTFRVSDGVNTAEKDVTIYVAPDASALLATVKTDHSRLLADDARFEELKSLIQTDENAKAWFAIVKRDADKLLADPTPVPYQCPDGVRLDTQGSKDVLNLAFMYRMTGDEAYLDRAWVEMEALCGEGAYAYPDWHPSHLLDTAMTANGVAIAYDWLYNYLTDEQRATAEAALYDYGLEEAEYQFSINHMFVTNGENWNYICNGGFITAALALAHNEEYDALVGKIMQLCYASIQYGLPQYAPEGASIEGISYWDYGTRYLVSLLASISSATTNNPFLNAPGLDITAEYPIYLSGKAGSYNYSDNDMVDAYGYLNMWLAHTYGDYSWNWYHKYYMEKGYDPTVYDLLYYYPAEYGGDAPANLDKFYTNQAVTTMRHDFTDPMSSFLGFKGGLNGAPHGDVDIGSFIYDIYGYRWAEDFGKDDYNLTGYWEIAPGGTRWNYYRKNAMGHNTLVFNPTRGANQTVGAYAGKTEQVLNEVNGGYTILDMTDAYQDNAVSVKRGFAYFDRTQVLIRDEFTLKAPGTAYWQMHTKASVEISADGKTATLTQGDYSIQLKLVGENAEDSLKFASMDATTYEGVAYEGLKSNEGYAKIYVKADGVQKAVFNVLITPVDMKTPEVKDLENWNEYAFCGDKNNDHKCDVCGNTLSGCADTDKNHKCDICGGLMTNCGDGNSDHKCDICDGWMTNCGDKNNNHKCDICGGLMTNCGDGNSDHKCDICDGWMTNCGDGNNDHKCDICGGLMTNCGDGNSDHKCDICGGLMTNCGDGNSDHKCDICGGLMTNCGDATVVVGEPASCTADGWKEHYKCSCGSLYEDKACTKPIADLESWKTGEGKIPAAHELNQKNAQAPTCDNTGWEAYEYCSNCDYSTYVEIPELGHDMRLSEEQTDPTCKEPGKTAVYTCASNCGKSEGGKEIPATGDHDFHDGNCENCGESDPDYQAPVDPSEPEESEPTTPSEPEESKPTTPSEPEEEAPSKPQRPTIPNIQNLVNKIKDWISDIFRPIVPEAPTEPSEPEEENPSEPSVPETEPTVPETKPTVPTDPSEPETEPTVPSKPSNPTIPHKPIWNVWFDWFFSLW